MPSPELMTWNKRAKRWFKKHRLKSYTVTVGKLRKLYPELVSGDSQHGSIQAANQWWTDKLPEIATEPPDDPDKHVLRRLQDVATHLTLTEDFERATEVQEKIKQVSKLRTGPARTPG